MKRQEMIELVKQFAKGGIPVTEIETTVGVDGVSSNTRVSIGDMSGVLATCKKEMEEQITHNLTKAPFPGGDEPRIKIRQGPGGHVVDAEGVEFGSGTVTFEEILRRRRMVNAEMSEVLIKGRITGYKTYPEDHSPAGETEVTVCTYGGDITVKISDLYGFVYEASGSTSEKETK